MDNGKLTSKQELFCEEYLVDLNATQAAIRAGYSKRSAASIGDENLSKREIMRRILQLQILRIRRTRIRADRVIKELEKIAFAEVDGVKMSDRIKALGMLCKHFGLFEKQQHQPSKSILEDKENLLEDMNRDDWNVYDAMTPKEREKILRSIDRYFGKTHYYERDN